MSRMFSCVTETWNPLGGACPHKCVYCFARKLAEKNHMEKYFGEIRLIEKEFHRQFKEGEMVFVQDMSDLFAERVPTEYIQKVFEHVKKFPKTTFLFLTKNPERYNDVGALPSNAVYGATIESDKITPEISSAPGIWSRAFGLWKAKGVFNTRVMVSIEPVLDFNLDIFLTDLRIIQPEFVYLGIDNYNCGLPEPDINKVKKLIEGLQKFTDVKIKPTLEAKL